MALKSGSGRSLRTLCLAVLPVALLVGGCADSTQQAQQCWQHYEAEYGNYTRLGPCPSNLQPWENPGRRSRQQS
jgi:hypothetical protein